MNRLTTESVVGISASIVPAIVIYCEYADVEYAGAIRLPNGSDPIVAIVLIQRIDTRVNPPVFLAGSSCSRTKRRLH